RLAEHEIDRLRGQLPDRRRAIVGADDAVSASLELGAELALAGGVVICHHHGSPGVALLEAPVGSHLRSSAGSWVKSRSAAIRMKAKARSSCSRRRRISAYIMQTLASSAAASRSASVRSASVN